MLPCLALLDVRYGGLVNAVFGGKGLALLSACETSLYLGNNIVGQNGVVPPAPGIFFLQLFKGRGTVTPKQMLPGATAGVVLHGYTSDAVLGADIINRHPSNVSAPDSQNRFIRLLRDGVGFATFDPIRVFGAPMVLSDMYRRLSVPLLSLHVRHVLGMGAKKKVRRVYARRVVASVADMASRWNRAIAELVSRAVGRHLLAENVNNSVPVAAFGAGPVPATFVVNPSEIKKRFCIHFGSVMTLSMVCKGQGGV